MKFLIALIGLIALIKADAMVHGSTDDYELDYLTSPTVNFTVPATVASK